jgi:tricorn protease
VRHPARSFVVFAVFALVLGPLVLAAVDTTDTKLLTQPAVGRDRIAFVYANDLWTADLDGRNVRRLTTDIGVETNPVFSPDGTSIAFSAQYDGNVDAYIVPAAGGVPRRLTWHPDADLVQDFTPDGKAVLFASPRSASTRAYLQLFTVPVAGGFPEMLKVPYAYRAVFSPDGKRLAYNPFPEAFTQWKNYRGGRNSRIWLIDLPSLALEKIPQPADRCNDAGPMWLGGKVYFRSDRNGEFNLFAYDPGTKEVKQLTFFKDYPVLNASAGAGRIIFEQAGALHLYDPAGGRTKRLTIGVATDLAELRERYAKGSQYIRSASISPTGARAVLEFRGEVVTVPAEKGDPRNITNSPAANDRAPVWSPDGKSIAYFSDASGEYELQVRDQEGKGEAKAYKLPGAGFYGSPVWSPDSQKISFADNAVTLFWIDLKTGAVKRIGSDYLYGAGRVAQMYSSWSPDSKWVAYQLGTKTLFNQVFVYSLDQDKSFPVTDGLSDAGEPVFDASGKNLLFFASTDAGPVLNWFDQSNADMRASYSIYLAVLRKDLPNPLAKESDEEKAAAKEEKPAEKKAAETAPPAAGKPAAAETAKGAPAAKTPEPVRIDFEGLDHRIVALPLPAGLYSDLQAGEAGKFFYLETRLPAGTFFDPAGIQTSLHVYDLNQRKDEVFLPGVTSYVLSADKKKLLYRTREASFIVATAAKPQPNQGRLNLDAVDVRFVPTAEWKQIFDEAWRVNRDFFYDPNMHGADWKAMKAKYEVFLPHIACRNDLNRVIQWMCSELAVGHHRGGGGDTFVTQARRVPGGLLGADFEIADGRYRFKKVYGGLNWNPDLRSPLTEPGVDVRAGEYLLAVEGRDLRAGENLHARFENTSGKIVELTVGPSADGKGSRTVNVVPVASEAALRNRDWVEGNLKKVHEATNGRVAYVYVPDTTTFGYIYFKRYFFPQADKDAIIVDERFNGGGSLADYYIDHLRKPVIAYWAMRYGADLKTPSASIQGPKVMLINETAGSGGDLLPWMWRKFGLGQLIGTRTWGGLVGVLGFPVLMDGGGITAPNLGIWTEDGFIVENVGVPPDIEVEQTPQDVMAGHDPQLEKAIQVVLEELKKNPPKTPQRPPFPIRVRK